MSVEELERQMNKALVIELFVTMAEQDERDCAAARRERQLDKNRREPAACGR